MLIALQFIVAALAVCSSAFRHMVTARPVVLAWEGRLLNEAMRAQRVTLDDIRAALRQRGYASVDQVLAVVLEADGSLSTVDTSGPGADTSSRGLVTAPD